MSRQSRQLKTEYCYHITVRCNNREFRLIRDECREVLSDGINSGKKHLRGVISADSGESELVS